MLSLQIEYSFFQTTTEKKTCSGLGAEVYSGGTADLIKTLHWYQCSCIPNCIGFPISLYDSFVLRFFKDYSTSNSQWTKLFYQVQTTATQNFSECARHCWSQDLLLFVETLQLLSSEIFFLPTYFHPVCKCFVEIKLKVFYWISSWRRGGEQGDHKIALRQSEGSIQVTGSLSANQRPVSM